MDQPNQTGAPLSRHWQGRLHPTPEAVHLTLTERTLRRFAAYLERLSAPLQYTIAALGILAVGSLDVVTDPNLSFSIFYAVPIALLAWYRGWLPARIAIFVSTVVWLVADYAHGPDYSSEAIRYWNAAMRLGFFIVVGYIVSQLRRAVGEEQRLARTDSLTSVANSRFFLEIAANEVARQQRYGHPLSLAFIDCDNFKQVNDRFGHATGDELLRGIASAIDGCLREVDTVARLGGDEFAILLPESDSHAAETVCAKVRDALNAAVLDFGVTFSVGLVTYVAPPASVEALVHSADDAMYEAKKTGKNSSRHRVITKTPESREHVK